MLNATEPAFADFNSMPTPLAPVTILSGPLRRYAHNMNANCIPRSVIHFLPYVHNTILMFESHMLEAKLKNSTTFISRGTIVKQMAVIAHDDELLPFEQPENKNPIFVACRCASSIHLNSFRQAIPFASDSNQNRVHQLRSCLSQVTEITWHKIDLEIFICLCFTGAVAARREKLWFLAKARPAGALLNLDESNNLMSGIFRFCRIVRYLEEINM